jgi:single-strand DNA-binding protein
MNSVAITGRLGGDPELRFTNNGKAVASFSLAIKQTKEITHWVQCEAWEKTAEFINQYFVKGDGIEIVGSLKEETWQDKNGGGKRSKLMVRVGQAHFPEGKAGGNGGQGEGDRQPARSGQQSSRGGRNDYGNDSGLNHDDLGPDEIPF